MPFLEVHDLIDVIPGADQHGRSFADPCDFRARAYHCRMETEAIETHPIVTDPTNATLVRREDLTDILSIVWVRPDGGEIPAFHPGQFVRLGVPRGPASQLASRPGRIRLVRRAYSIASSPLEKDALEFFVVRIEAGQLTPRLWAIDPGGRLWMDDEAKGEFSLEVAPPDADLVMVSTGTGIAPFVSMLRTYRGQQRWRRLVVIYGVRYAADLGYRAEFEAAAREDPSIIFIPLTTRECVDSSWTGLRGRVQTALEPHTYQRLAGAPLDPARCHVFLCGNPDMIDTVQSSLESRGFATDSRAGPGNIHFERYW